MIDGTINEHYLDKVLDLAEQMPVVADEDIFDARGNKLLTKGAHVSRSLQEKLIVHKLKKPLEASLSVVGGVDAAMVVNEAEELLRNVPALTSLVAVSTAKGASPISMLSRLKLGKSTTLMLTIFERGGTSAFEHAVMVSIVACCMAKHLNVPPEGQEVCTLAGLLHDLGELYIHPDILVPGRQLQPHEWSHVVVHPRTGQIIIDELDSYPSEVGRAVAEHHERLDGTGYPKRLLGSAISLYGQAVAAAEAVTGLLKTNCGLERAELALKLITTEHDRRILNTISAAKHHHREFNKDYTEASHGQRISSDVYKRLLQSIDVGKSMEGAPGISAATREFVSKVVQRLRLLERIAISCGLDLDLESDEIEAIDNLLIFEHSMASREINFRMREVARDIGMGPFTQGERGLFSPLVQSLDPTLPM